VSSIRLSANEYQNAGNQCEKAQDDDWDRERQRRDNSINDEKDRQHEHAKIFIDDHTRSLADQQSCVTPKCSRAMARSGEDSARELLRLVL
jgi:hypothetical protein